MKKNKQKTVVVRAHKIAPRRYLLEQKRKFLWFWEFWQKGVPTLGLGKYMDNKQVIKTAVYARAQKKNIRPILIIQ